MTDDEQWIMRPVLARMCLYESLKNGSLTLVDVAVMNEALDVQAENTYRATEHERQRNKGKP